MRPFRVKLGIEFEIDVEVEAENFDQAKRRAIKATGAISSASMNNFDYLKDWELGIHPQKVYFKELISNVYYRGLKLTGVTIRKDKSGKYWDRFYIIIETDKGTIKKAITSDEYDFLFDLDIDQENSIHRTYTIAEDLINEKLDEYLDD